MTPYYETPLGKLYHGDCLEIMPELEPVDLVLTDPPYGVDLGNHCDAKEKRKNVGLKKQKYTIYEDTHENFIKIIVPSIKMAISKSKCGRAIVFCSGMRIWDYPRANTVSAIYLPSGQGSTGWGFQNFAHFLLYGTAPNMNKGRKNIALKSGARAEKNGHPCPKPIAWISWLIQQWTEENQIILDPFLGSGTAAVSCEHFKRKWIGIEIEEKYCEIAAKRIEQERKQLKLF